MKIKMNGKKGFVSEPLVFLLSLITFFLIAFAFYLFISLPSCSNKPFEKKITSETSINPQIEYSIQRYLTMPLKMDINNDNINESIEISDLIQWSVNNSKYDILDDKTQKFFDSTEYYFVITLNKDSNGEIKELKKMRRKSWVRLGKYVNEEIMLPGYFGSKNINVQFSIATGESSEDYAMRTSSYPIG